jgi:propionyl-CoA:succinyl-CoA transferase
MYTEVLQDSVVPLLENGRGKFASTTALAISQEMADRVYGNLNFFRQRVLMRPQEISNHPEVARRLGIISMNTAIEIDLFGNVNSSHIMGRQMVNGIGGSGDFARNAYISMFSCPSTRKEGKISTVVPLVSHTDHSEHSVHVLITEHGVADLRGKDPRQRAETVIDNCADPTYREQLRDYLKFVKPGHEPLAFPDCFAMHEKFVREGDMRGVRWEGATG